MQKLPAAILSTGDKSRPIMLFKRAAKHGNFLVL